MSYLIKMLIKKGICCLLFFNGNFWGLEKGRGVFCGNVFFCEVLIDRVFFLGNVFDLGFCLFSLFFGFYFKKSYLGGIFFLYCLV